MTKIDDQLSNQAEGVRIETKNFQGSVAELIVRVRSFFDEASTGYEYGQVESAGLIPEQITTDQAIALLPNLLDSDQSVRAYVGDVLGWGSFLYDSRFVSASIALAKHSDIGRLDMSTFPPFEADDYEDRLLQAYESLQSPAEKMALVKYLFENHFYSDAVADIMCELLSEKDQDFHLIAFKKLCYINSPKAVDSLMVFLEHLPEDLQEEFGKVFIEAMGHDRALCTLRTYRDTVTSTWLQNLLDQTITRANRARFMTD